MNEQTQNNKQRSRFLKNCYSKSKKLILQSNSENTIWIVDPFTQVTSAKHMAKFNTKSISNQGTFCNFSLAPKRKIHKTSDETFKNT